MTDTLAELVPAPPPPLQAQASGVIIVLDEKPLCRAAVANFAAEVTGIARITPVSTIPQAMEALPSASAGLLLVDLFTTNYDFGAIQRLVASAPNLAVMAIDDRVNPAFAQMAREAGARGYVAKSQDEAAFRRVLTAIIRGEEFFPEPQLASGRHERPANKLSPRQLDVLKKLAGGKTNKEIAEALGIAPRTVKLHIHAILRLTGARNRTEAALIAGRFIAPTLRRP